MANEEEVRVDYKCPHCGGTMFKIAASVNVIIDANDDRSRIEDSQIPFYYDGTEPAQCMGCDAMFDELDDVIVRE
jgi:hypothetical protein